MGKTFWLWHFFCNSLSTTYLSSCHLKSEIFWIKYFESSESNPFHRSAFVRHVQNLTQKKLSYHVKNLFSFFLSFKAIRCGNCATTDICHPFSLDDVLGVEQLQIEKNDIIPSTTSQWARKIKKVQSKKPREIK